MITSHDGTTASARFLGWLRAHALFVNALLMMTSLDIAWRLGSTKGIAIVMATAVVLTALHVVAARRRGSPLSLGPAPGPRPSAAATPSRIMGIPADRFAAYACIAFMLVVPSLVEWIANHVR